MTTAVFRLREAESEDIPAMAALDVSAFLDSPMHKAMFPEHLRVKPGVQDQVDWNMSRMISGFADPRTHFTVVTTKRPEGGYIIVGCAEWRSPIPASERGNAVLEKEKEEEAEKSDEEKELDLEQRLARLPSCLDKKAVLAANDEIQQLLVDSKDCFKGKERSEMWTLNSISVDGDYRGKGIGKMLTRWGMEKAAQEKADMWLISSPLGRRLYHSLGFQEVAEGSRCSEPQYVMLKLYEEK